MDLELVTRMHVGFHIQQKFGMCKLCNIYKASDKKSIIQARHEETVKLKLSFCMYNRPAMFHIMRNMMLINEVINK